MSVPRRIAAMLDVAASDADACQILLSAGNRNAAYHCQQALEKLFKAVLLHRSIEAGREHHLDALLAKIPANDPWASRLAPFVDYSGYATAFRYPTPGGRYPVGS